MIAAPVQVARVPVTSDPVPDEELAAISGAPEPAADVPAREPDALFSDPTEQGWSGRPDVLERHEVIGVVCGHGTTSGVRAEHTWVGSGGPCTVALRGSERARRQFNRTCDDGAMRERKEAREARRDV